MKSKEKQLNLIAALIAIVPAIVIIILNPIQAEKLGGIIFRYSLNAFIAAILFWVGLDYAEKDFDASDFEKNGVAILLVVVVYGLCGYFIIQGIENGFLRFVAFTVIWMMAGVLTRFLVVQFWRKWNPEPIAQIPNNAQTQANDTDDDMDLRQLKTEEYSFYCLPIVSTEESVTSTADTVTTTTTKTYNMSRVTRHTLILPTWRKIFHLRWVLGIIIIAVASFFINAIIAVVFSLDYPYFLIWNVPPRGDTLIVFILQLLVILFLLWAGIIGTYQAIVEQEMRRFIRRHGYFRRNKDFDVVEASKWTEFRGKLRKTH